MPGASYVGEVHEGAKRAMEAWFAEIAAAPASGRKTAAVMVSGDTGPTHLAAAAGTPLVGIYGPTRPERNGPWLPEDITVSRSPQCRCHHLRRCRLDTMCLMDIDADEVAQAVGRRLVTGRLHG